MDEGVVTVVENREIALFFAGFISVLDILAIFGIFPLTIHSYFDKNLKKTDKEILDKS